MAEQKARSAASSQNVPADAPKGASAANGTNDGASVSEQAANVDAADAEELVDDVMEAEAAASADGTPDEAESETQAADAQREAAEWKDKYVRLHAEWDTYRRRTKEQQEVQKALAAEKLVTSLIPVIDDLERSIDYAEKNGETGLLDGVRAVLTKFVNTLEKDGVEVIDPVGEAFEALEAQAVATVEDASQPDETVNDVYQKGYKIGKKVLRPAMVTVTTGGPKREKPAAEDA